MERIFQMISKRKLKKITQVQLFLTSFIIQDFERAVIF